MKNRQLKFVIMLLTFIIALPMLPDGVIITNAADIVTVYEDIDISAYLNHDSFSTEREKSPVGASWTNLGYGGGLDLDEFEKLSSFDKASQRFLTDNCEYKMYNLYAPAQSEHPENKMTPTDIYTLNGDVTVHVNKSYDKLYFLATSFQHTDAYSVSIKYEGESAAFFPIVSSVGSSNMSGAYYWESDGQKNVFANEKGNQISIIGPDENNVPGGTRADYSCVYEYYVNLDSAKIVESITFGKLPNDGQGVYIFSITGSKNVAAGEILCEKEDGTSIEAQVMTEKKDGKYVYMADFGKNTSYMIKSVGILMNSENSEIFGSTVYGSEDGIYFEPLSTVTQSSKNSYVFFDVISNNSFRYIKLEDCAVPSIFEAKIIITENKKADENLIITGEISAEGSYKSGSEWYKAFDSDESTSSFAEDETGNSFIIYTGLNDMYKPTSVEIIADSLDNALLEGSTDGCNYEVISKIEENNQLINTEKYYNYFRFSSAYNNIGEFKLIGTRNDGSYAVISNPQISGDGITGVPITLTYNVVPSYAQVVIEWYCNDEKIENEDKIQIIPFLAGTYYAVVSSKTGERTESNKITVKQDNLPVAKYVFATGSLNDGETLYGTYVYEDSDNHEQGNTVMQWYRNGEAITDANSDTYILTSDDVGKVISFGVTPWSKNPDVSGEEVKYTFSETVKESVYSKISQFTYDYEPFFDSFDGDITTRPYFDFSPEAKVTFTFPDTEQHSLDKFRYHTSNDNPEMADKMQILGTNDFQNYDVLYIAPSGHTYGWYEAEIGNYRKYKAFCITNLSTGRVAELEFYEKSEKYIDYPVEYKMPGVLNSGVFDTGYFYPEKLTAVKFTTNSPSSYNGKKIYGSNDNVNWTELGVIKNAVSGENRIEISDNGVYRYFRCDAALDYYATAYNTQYPSLSEMKFKNIAAVGGKLVPEFEFFALNGEINKEKFVYFWYNSSDGKAWNKISDANKETYTVKASDLSKYIKCEIIPVSTHAPYGRNRFSVQTAEPVKALGVPQADNVKVTGIVKENNVIKASYDFYDPNGLTESGSEYSWYKSIDGKNWELIKDELGNPYTDKNYTVKSNDENFLIQFRVTPKVAEGKISGKTTVGETKISNNASYAVAPIAENVQILCDKDISKIAVGDTVKLKYTYYDANNEEENGTVIEWKRGATVISSKDEYVITEDDINSMLSVSVKVKNNGELGNDAEIKEISFKAPYAPEVFDVNISGAGAVGYMLTVSYKFRDENGNANVGTEVVWYSGNTKLGEGMSYIVKPSDAGKNIYFKIIPKTDVMPYEGKAYTSNSIPIAYSGTISAGGGGGSYGGSSMTNSSVQTNNFIPAVVETPVVEAVFSDIKNHWAEKEITELAGRKIVKGNGVGYAPDNTMTRAEAMAVIIRAMGENENTPYKTGLLHDVSADDWYAGALQAAYNAKIITVVGISFEPNRPVTRQELCNYIINAYIQKTGKNPEASDISAFKDRDKITTGNDLIVGQAVKLGIVKGMDDGTFYPDGNATRAQVAVMIIRLLAAMGK